jgi:hypothetical protein
MWTESPRQTLHIFAASSFNLNASVEADPLAASGRLKVRGFTTVMKNAVLSARAHPSPPGERCSAKGGHRV